MGDMTRSERRRWGWLKKKKKEAERKAKQLKEKMLKKALKNSTVKKVVKVTKKVNKKLGKLGCRAMCFAQPSRHTKCSYRLSGSSCHCNSWQQCLYGLFKFKAAFHSPFKG